jgi:glutamine synthetase
LPLRAWFRHYDLDVFLAIRRQERERFGALVTDRDYEWYLDTA